jgi:hypothetical protein
VRLARFRAGGRDSIGVVADGAVADVGTAIPSLPVDMVQLLEAWDVWSDRIAGAQDGAPSLDLTQVELLAPVACPRKVLDIGLNYPALASEGGPEPKG